VGGAGPGGIEELSPNWPGAAELAQGGRGRGAVASAGAPEQAQPSQGRRGGAQVGLTSSAGAEAEVAGQGT